MRALKAFNLLSAILGICGAITGIAFGLIWLADHIPWLCVVIFLSVIFYGLCYLVVDE